MEKTLIILVCLGHLAPLCAATTLHVATTGSDTNPGTAEQPLASVSKALAVLKDEHEPCEIVIHAGVYLGSSGDGISVGNDRTCGKSPLPSLLITAAKKADGGYEEVWFDGGRQIREAEPVAGKPGVYRFAVKPEGGSAAPQVWEADSRTRYVFAADLAAVELFPASFCQGDSEMFLHTSDGRPPETHDLHFGHDGFGFFVWWQNTTLRGLKFRNFLHSGARLCAPDTTLEDCYASNCLTGFKLEGASWTGVEARNMRLLRCATEDCAGGVYIEGKHAIVEDCRFFKRRDKFMIPIDMQNDCGIQYYFPSSEGEVRRNLCVGFAEGIFMKCNSSVFVVEHNTLVIGQTSPSFCFGWAASQHPQSIIRYNISVGGVWPIQGAGDIPPGMTVDYNCFWKNTEENTRQKCFEMLRKAGAGGHDLVKDPRFANPAKGDYRLLPDSPCLKVGPQGSSSEASAKEGETCGAFGAVGPDFKDVQPPEVLLSLALPAVPAGGAGELYFERDPWIGGGTTLVQKLSPEGKTNEWVTPNPRVNLMIEAEDFVGKPSRMKFQVGSGAWSAPKTFAGTKELDVPSKTAVTPVSVMVSDTAGNWSQPTRLMVRVAKEGPRLKGAPVVCANDHGVVISFATDIPCLPIVEFGEDTKYGSNLEQPRDVQRLWNAEDGGEWVTIRTKPRMTNCFALLEPTVATGKTYHYRLILKDEAGNKTVTDDFTFTVKGTPRDYVVSPEGEDTDGRGTRENPLRTLQFAVDHALPGDRIVLLPGLYGGQTKLTHGGLKGAPITIEAGTPGTAILDGCCRSPSCVYLLKAPHVVLRGLEIRWFTHSAVYAVDSPNVAVEKSRIWNPGAHAMNGIGSTCGTFTHRSPGFVADHTVMYNLAHGFYLLQCPQSRITFNTVCGTDFGGAAFVFSAAGTVSRNNSFAYNSNDQFTIESADANEMATFDSDYNNLRARPDSKAVIGKDGKRFRTLKAWQDASGKDLHSISADPLYCDAAHHDLRLQPGSPNIGAGEGGATIGALGVKEK